MAPASPPLSKPSTDSTSSNATTIRWTRSETFPKFEYQNGEDAMHRSILESVGGGIACFDFDNDQQIDVYLTGGGHFEGQTIVGDHCGLLRKKPDSTFTDVSIQAGCSQPGFYSHGAIAGDFDDDGFVDLLVSGYGGMTLFHNRGDGTFHEIAAAAGLEDPNWSTAAAWADLNGDGTLDLYVVHYVDWSFENNPHCGTDERPDVCSPKVFNGVDDRLFFNEGNGTFRDGSQEAGLGPEGKGLGVLIAEMTGDRHLDIYVANDTTPNFFYINDGKGKFVESGLLSGTALDDSGQANGSMGVDLADYNLDGLPDIGVANYERESFAVYSNQGEGQYLYASRTAGVMAEAGSHVGFGTLFFDMDHDGDEDLFVSNGHVILYPDSGLRSQTPFLFENDRGKQFRNIAPRLGSYFTAKHLGRGVATTDVDDDGDLDLIVSHCLEPVELLLNESTGSSSHWLALELIGTRSSRDVVGAEAKLQVGEMTMYRQKKGGASYLSTSEPILHFGWPEGLSPVTLQIRWPRGDWETVPVQPDRRIVLREP